MHELFKNRGQRRRCPLILKQSFLGTAAPLSPIVVAVCISGGGIPKHPQSFAGVSLAGLKNDGHNHAKHNNPLQAVCLQDEENLEQLRREGFPLNYGTVGENITVRNLHVQRLSVGDILEFEGGVILELTKERKPCYVLDAIDPRLKEAIIGRCGFYAKVIKEGIIKPKETIQVRELSCL